MKHKHAELIKAWADGAEIEVLKGENWVYNSNPDWAPAHNYRVKPKLIEIEKSIYLHYSGMNICEYHDDINANVRFSFDPLTKKLIKVELI